MVVQWFLHLSRISIAQPKKTLLVLFLVTLAFAPGLSRLKLRTDGHALVPPDDPVVKFDAEVRERFQLRDPIIVLIETSHYDGIYNLDTIKRVQEISEALSQIDGIDPLNVMSLATERRDRVFPGTTQFRKFLDPLPETEFLMTILRMDIEAAKILDGTLVSDDDTATSIIVGVPTSSRGDPEILDERTRLYREIVAIVEPFQNGPDRIFVAGAPVAESLLGIHILEDLALMVPLAFALIALILWLGCRRFRGVLIGLVEVAACLLFTFGLMGWLGYPVYLTTALLPVMLTTMGLADEVHIFWHYQHVLKRGGESGPHPGAVVKTMEEMVRPVALTSVTTSLGLLSFLFSSIEPVRVFGLFAALGILFCMAWSFTAVPAWLALISPEKMERPESSIPPGRGWILELVSPMIQRRKVTLAVLLVITLGMGFGLQALYVQDGWIDGFAPGSDFRQATDHVNKKLFGTHTLLAQLTFDPPPEDIPEVRDRKGPLLDPAAHLAIGDFEEFLRKQPHVGGVLGLYSHLTTVAYLWRGRRAGGHTLPDKPERIAQLYKLFDRGRGKHRRREVVDQDLRRAIVSIYLKNANYRDTAHLVEAVRSYEREHLAPKHVKVDFAGDVAVSQAMIPAIVRTQVSSLLLALTGAFVVIFALYRSLRTSILAVLPAAVAVLWTFGIMGWLDVPLGVATSMFCAITLGIGVDFAIHFMERYREGRDENRPAPVLDALRIAGPAILMDTVAVALGLGLLAFSQVPSSSRLGLLTAFALTASCILTLVGLGSLLAKPQPSMVRREERGGLAPPHSARWG